MPSEFETAYSKLYPEDLARKLAIVRHRMARLIASSAAEDEAKRARAKMPKA